MGPSWRSSARYSFLKLGLIAWLGARPKGLLVLVSSCIGGTFGGDNDVSTFPLVLVLVLLSTSTSTITSTSRAGQGCTPMSRIRNWFGYSQHWYAVRGY